MTAVNCYAILNKELLLLDKCNVAAFMGVSLRENHAQKASFRFSNITMI